ncbi:MAG: serine hydrolase domain-containing protein [Parvicellaceae bacterium]
MKKSLFLIFLCFLMIIGCSEKKTEPKSYLEITNKQQIDGITQTFIDREAYPFIYTRLEDSNGTVIYENSFKNERLLADNNIDGESWIRIWSMSKIVTICIALDLMEDSIISLNDSVTKYIPEFSNLKVAITSDSSAIPSINWYNNDTLRANPCPLNYIDNDSIMKIFHLMTHKAGFYYATTNIECLDSMVAKQNLASSINSDDFINRMAQLPLAQHPGCYEYYGTAISVLGILCERATGKSLAQLVKERITDPMKIKGLVYDLPNGAQLFPKFSGKDSIIRIAYDGELDIMGQNVPDYFPEHKLYLGGVGMLATANGYCDFLRMLLNKGILNGHRFLNESTVEDLTSPKTQLDNEYGYNGYNIWISGKPYFEKGIGDEGLWIGGGYEGTHFWIDPKRGFVGTIMTQMFGPYEEKYAYSRDNRVRGAIYQPWTKMSYIEE